MWPDDPITESPGMAPPSRIDLSLPTPRHTIPGEGVLWGLLYGSCLWFALAAIVCVLL